MIGIYARVSTEEQAKKGYSIADQIRQCRLKAQNNEIIEYVDEGYSGEFLERPALDQLRRDVREGIIGKVIIYDPDRWSRNLMNQLLITDEIEKRAVLIFVNSEYEKSPEGRLFYQIRGAVSEFEKAKINERMSRGRREKARQGRVLRDFQIYGYSYDKETQQIVINEDEATIVRLVFDLLTRPNTMVKGINGIAHYLTEKGVPTKRGAKVWHRQVVRQMLMNRAYAGEFHQNKWNTEGMLGNKYRSSEDKVSMRMRPKDEWIPLPCPEIISITQFEHAQQLLAESKRRWAKDSKHKYLLSGLLRCGDCGNTLVGRQSNNWGVKIFEYSDHKNTAGAKHKGCGVRIRCNALDDEIWNTVLNWLNQPDEIAATVTEEPTSSLEQLEKERVEKELERAKMAKKRLIKLFASGDDGSADVIREELRELSDKEAHLTERLVELEQLLQKEKSFTLSKNVLQEAISYYLTKSPDQLTFEDKQELIRQVIREIRVTKDKIEVYSF